MHRAIFFFSDIWTCYSASSCFSSGSYECIYDSSSDQGMQRLFFQHHRWVVERRIQMTLWASLSTCGIHLSQPVHFPKLLVRIWQTLAGKNVTSVAISMQKILHVHSSTDFTCSMWHSSVADVGALLRGASSISSGPFLMAFTQQHTVLYEGACVPKPSFNDL